MSNARTDTDARSGPLAWMVHHRVAPNLLMLVFIFGGLFMLQQIQKEVFPDFELDVVTVSVSYPGATPDEVESGVVLALEEAVSDLDGIDEVRSTAREGSGSVDLELTTGASREQLYQEVLAAVGRITTLPAEAEQPVVTLRSRQRHVVDLQIHGDASEQHLRRAAEQVRERVLESDAITQADLEGARSPEIHIDIPDGTLQAHGLTLDQVAGTVAGNAIDRAGGSIRTQGGEILLRVTERREWAEEFADIIVATTPAGGPLRLGDIAEIREGFEDVISHTSFAGEPAIGVGVYRVEDQTPTGISQAVRDTLPQIMAELPPGIEVSVRNDRSEIYDQRVGLLLKNGFIGLLLVLLLLALFLEFKLAFWVTVGIPTAFLGAFLFLPWFGVSINMVSMFAFIIALGIVVDDAIVAGENIYEYRQRGMGNLRASIQGARDIARPIAFSILTNVVAFLPLLFIPGTFGQIWAVIPAVVATVFIISWIEVLYILPTHLAYTREGGRTGPGAFLHRHQQRFSNAFSRFIQERYRPFLALTVEWRYVTTATAIVILLLALAIPMSGRMGFILMPSVEADQADATVTLPVGSPEARVLAVRDEMVEAIERVIEENGGDALSQGVYASVSENRIRLRAYLQPPDKRPLETAEVVRLWRREAGDIPGTESIRYESDRGGPGGGPGISGELSHPTLDVLDSASGALAARLEELSPVTDIDDGFTPGKRQFDIRLTETARASGLTTSDIGDQVRHAFHGAEALRLLRGRDEVQVMVRRPEGERQDITDVEQMLIRLPDGGYAPLTEVATLERGRGFTTIERRDNRRTVTVTADVEPAGETQRIIGLLREEMLPALMDDYPGLAFSFEGRQAQMRDAVQSFFSSVTVALLVIYALLAIPFRSYVQPLIIMSAIPFGIVGAILGHLIMGYNLSMISVMGIIALGGVVVNTSLVMLDYANARRAEGLDAVNAVIEAGARRFRPILLTSLTTFGGLAPMIFETSRQARFMIPMAISLGYGILFAAAILLILIPSLYAIADDAQRLTTRLRERLGA